MPANNLIQFMTRRETQTVVLIVEDDELHRKMLEHDLKDMNYQTLSAANGEEALTMLGTPGNGISIVLMDRYMPTLDGLSTVRRMKDDPLLRKIPVIMVSGATGDQDVREGMEAGVFYYLGKPYDERMLRSVMTATTREVEQNRTLTEEMKRNNTAFTLMQNCKFKFKTLEEAEALAGFAAHFYPEPEKVLPGLAELLINAIEHGNLEIGYTRKTALLDAGTWRAEIERRQAMPEYADRSVEFVVMHKDDGIYMIITDQGKGFDWQKYLMIDPSRASDSHGRGIAQSRAMCFDSLSYNAAGNQVVAKVSHEKALEW